MGRTSSSLPTALFGQSFNHKRSISASRPGFFSVNNFFDDFKEYETTLNNVLRINSSKKDGITHWQKFPAFFYTCIVYCICLNPCTFIANSNVITLSKNKISTINYL